MAANVCLIIFVGLVDPRFRFCGITITYSVYSWITSKILPRREQYWKKSWVWERQTIISQHRMDKLIEHAELMGLTCFPNNPPNLKEQNLHMSRMMMYYGATCNVWPVHVLFPGNGQVSHWYLIRVSVKERGSKAKLNEYCMHMFVKPKSCDCPICFLSLVRSMKLWKRQIHRAAAHRKESLTL